MLETTLKPKRNFSLSAWQRACILLAGLISIVYGGVMLLYPRTASIKTYAFSECVERPAGKPVSAEKWGSQGTYFCLRHRRRNSGTTSTSGRRCARKGLMARAWRR